MTTSGPLERQIVDNILRYLRTVPRCIARKTHGDSHSVVGTPDILGCVEGFSFVIEAKRPGNKPTPAQEHQLELWRQAGAVAFVATSVDEVKAMVPERVVPHFERG